MIEKLFIRKQIEEREATLSPLAARNNLSRGRECPETPCPVRTAFQRDRDRIIHSKAFRRLKHKTQVFIAPLGDHYATRLTHTLEVSQIARTISRALNLNEDLTEAIALGHDLGHTPFGHIGEEVLNELSPGGFRHSEQSLRVIEVLEKDGNGLNLTWEVRDGILNHSKPLSNILSENRAKASTFEGKVVQLSDSVAYINHDIDDAVRAEIISETDLPAASRSILGEGHSARINTMVCNVIFASRGIRDGGIEATPALKMSTEILTATNQLRDFLFENVYRSLSHNKEAAQARNVINSLYRHFLKHPQDIPSEYPSSEDNPSQLVVDYIAGMTDQFALRLAAEI